MNKPDTCAIVMNYIGTRGPILGRRRKYVAQFVSHLYDGEEQGLQGGDLYKYARNQTCGFDPWLWITIVNLLFQAFKLWLEWRKAHPKHWGTA